MKYLLIPILILSFLICPVYAQDNKAYTSQVKRVIDGNTIELINGEKVRLIGIDTPESKPNKKAQKDAERTGDDLEAITNMGKQAYEYTKRLVEGKEVRLEFDVGQRDKYERLLAYVYVLVCRNCNTLRSLEYEYRDFEEPSSEKDNYLGGFGTYIFLNATIIKNGYASPMTIPPNVKYVDLFKELYEEARENKRGLWRVAVEKKEGEGCNSNYECANIDCSKYDTPVKEGYQPYCEKSKCKCMCYGCK